MSRDRSAQESYSGVLGIARRHRQQKPIINLEAQNSILVHDSLLRTTYFVRRVSSDTVHRLAAILTCSNMAFPLPRWGGTPSRYNAQ